MSSDAQDFARLHRLTPADAVAYLQRRQRISLTYGWQDLWQDEHAHQFTVSRLARADLVQALRDQITASVQGDLSRTDFMRNARAALSQAGWWGRTEVVEAATGEIHRTTFDPARLKLIFDVNTRQASAAGQWERIQGSRATHPYVRYITRRDERVRELHRQWDHVTLPVEHPFWATHFPPNGWRCRCRVVAVSQREYDRGVAPGGALMKKSAPELEWRQWHNRRSDQIETIPVGIDPGFGYNPGLARARQAHAVVLNKMLSLDAPTGAALWQDIQTQSNQHMRREWHGAVQRLGSTRRASAATHLVHVLGAALQQALVRHGLQLASAAVLMRDTELLHALRARKVERDAHVPETIWAALPEQLERATLYLDTQDMALIYAIALEGSADRQAKIVVRLNYADKARLERQRQRVTANFVQTGGVVDAVNLTTGRRYIKLSD